MTTYTEVQFNKLPRWAQDLVRRSEANVEHMAKREAAALEAAGFRDSDRNHDYAVFPLTELAVRFLIDDDAYLEVRPEEIGGHRGVSVSVSRGSLALFPRTGNAAFVTKMGGY